MTSGWEKLKRLPMEKTELKEALAEVWRKAGIRATFVIWSDKHLTSQTTVEWISQIGAQTIL
jgi:hypothetical protein